MKGLVTFQNVSQVAPPRELAQQRRALQRSQAHARVNAGVHALLDGFTGSYLEDLVLALIAKTADVAAAHKDGPFVSSMFGKHAARVCGSSRVDPMAAAHGVFKTEPDALAEVE